MTSLKKLLTALFVVVAITVSTSFANAADIGVVDLDQVIDSYSKAQDISSEMKVKEAELQSFLAEAQKKLKNNKLSPVEKKNLEEKLTKEFKIKGDKYRKYQITQMKQIEKNIFDTIGNVSKKEGFDVVLTKKCVLVGGSDITSKVVDILNAKK